MTYTVNWTKKAKRTFDQNIEYLEQGVIKPSTAVRDRTTPRSKL